MVRIVHTRNLTISYFTSTHRRTIRRKSSNSYQIPSERLSKNSSNQEMFDTAKVKYKDALKKSGLNVDLEYNNNKSEKLTSRKRNIVSMV